MTPDTAITLAILTYRTLQQVKRQADASQKQVRIMQQQLEASERSWVKLLTCEPSFLYFVNGSAGVAGKAKIQNIGRSVATHIRIGTEIGFPLFAKNGMAFLPSKQAETCSSLTKGADKVEMTLFPQDLTTEAVRGFKAILETEINIVQGQRSIMPVIAGCIDYQDSVSRDHHQTSFVFHIVNWPSNDASSLFFTLPKTLGTGTYGDLGYSPQSRRAIRPRQLATPACYAGTIPASAGLAKYIYTTEVVVGQFEFSCS